MAGRFGTPLVGPNVTGDLHLGHALMVFVEDSLVRFHRQQGREVHFIPGMDHAGIALYSVVRASPDYHPELPLRARLRAWATEYRDAIREQLRALDLACEWQRETYTLEPRYRRLVRAAFHRLAEAGLLYRERAVVHWCPGCRTTISDMECERGTAQRRVALLPVGLGTRRWVVEWPAPELLPGAVACRLPLEAPEGATAVVPGLPRPLAILPGAAPRLVVPGHDPDDHALALRLGLPVVEVLDGAGRSLLPESAGFDREELRRSVLERWNLKSVMKQVEVSRCARCDEEVHGLLTWQWFLRMRPLLEPLMAAVRSGEVRFLPEHTEREAMDWMARAEDWCISRQIPWGHRIPARVCRRCAGWTTKRLRSCPECGGPLDVDRDVLDTWFSASLWPIGTAGWPDEGTMSRLYPWSVITSGRDLLFFWYIRLLAMDRFFTGAFPTPVCYSHGLVVSADGSKMTKSRGNTVTVSQALAVRHADALRMGLLAGCSGSRDVRLRDQPFHRATALRDRLLDVERTALAGLPDADGLTDWCRSEVADARERVAAALERFAYSEAVDALAVVSDRVVGRWLRVRAGGGGGSDGAERALVGELGGLFEPFMPDAGGRLQRLGRAAGPGPDPSRVRAVDRFMAAVEELEQLRGAVGINTVEPVWLAMPDADRAVLAGERWLTTATRLRLVVDGAPNAGAVPWRSTRAPGAVLWLPAGRADRLRAEAIRRLRSEANELRRLRRRTSALADPPAGLARRRADLAARAEALRANAGSREA
jgi:valyl-tRNA synthetase